MKSYLLAAIFTALVLSMATSHAQEAEPKPPVPKPAAARPDVTIRATMIALPNAEAAQFSAKQDLSGKPADALDALEKLVGQKKATALANLAVTTKSGQRAVSESGKRHLEVEPVVSPDGKSVDITLVLSDHGHKIVTSFLVNAGGAKFLGSVQSPTDAAMTEYFFVRVSL